MSPSRVEPTPEVPGAPAVVALRGASAGLGAVVDPERARRVVEASRALVDLARQGQPELLAESEALVAGLVSMIGATEAAINALAAQRTALLAIATAVVEAAPGVMVPMLPDAPVTAADRDHARRALVAEVAATTGASESTTATLAYTADDLVTHLPSTLTAMAAGAIGDRHVRHVARHAEGLSVEAMRTYEADVLARVCADRSPAGVGRAARLARERCHPRTLRERHERAWRDRTVLVEPAADGMAWLSAFLPAVQATAIFDKLTGVARTLGESEGEERTLPQRRADALTALVLDPPAPELFALDGPDALPASGAGDPAGVSGRVGASGRVGVSGRGIGPGGRGPRGADPGGDHLGASGLDIGHPTHESVGRDDPRGTSLSREGPARGQPGGPAPWALDPALRALRPTVAVTVPVLTLLGHSDEPAHLEGYGPIDADTARVLAARAPSFIRLLTHPESGTVLSVGRERYTVPADLRTWLRIRDEVCRFPGCHRRAARADVDHTVPFRERGHRGKTAAQNLAHLCPSHHRLKHRTRWSVVQHDDGRLTWTSPTGREVTTEPAIRMRGHGRVQAAGDEGSRRRQGVQAAGDEGTRRRLGGRPHDGGRPAGGPHGAE